MDQDERMGVPERPIDLQLSDKELALLRTGLEMLEDTFGHEEAEELEEVQALLTRLAGMGARGSGASTA